MSEFLMAYTSRCRPGKGFEPQPKIVFLISVPVMCWYIMVLFILLIEPSGLLTRQSRSFMEGLRGRGSLDVWYHGGLEYRCRTIDPGAWYNTVREGGWRIWNFRY